MTVARLISTGCTLGKRTGLEFGDELWLTNDALVLVRRGGTRVRMIAGVGLVVALGMIGGMVDGLILGMAGGALGGLFFWLFVLRGREDPGSSASAWAEHLRDNKSLMTVLRTDIATARLKEGMTTHLELVSADGFVTKLSWQRDRHTNAKVLAALEPVLAR